MEKKTPSQLHTGHRKRMESRFLAADGNGNSGFEAHELLEMLLFFSVPRRNTNETAHLLLAEFGSLRGVLEAPLSALKKVSGVGIRSAFLIRLVSEVMHAYIREPQQRIGVIRLSDLSPLSSYLHNLFFGYRCEMLYMFLFDSSGEMMHTQFISSGTATHASFDACSMMKIALYRNAAFVILAHNHPSGSTVYSDDDLCITRDLDRALNTVGIQLMEHYIVTEDTCVGIISDMRRVFSEREPEGFDRCGNG